MRLYLGFPGMIISYYIFHLKYLHKYILFFLVYTLFDTVFVAENYIISVILTIEGALTSFPLILTSQWTHEN